MSKKTAHPGPRRPSARRALFGKLRVEPSGQTGRPPLPPGQKRIPLPVHLRPENEKWLRDEAWRRNISMSELVNKLIRAEREIK